MKLKIKNVKDILAGIILIFIVMISFSDSVLANTSNLPQEKVQYYSFMNGIKKEFDPKWDELYIEFNFNRGITLSTDHEKDSVNILFNRKLNSLGLIRLDQNLYRLSKPDYRHEVICELRQMDEVQKLEVVYSSSSNVRYFARYIKVFFENSSDSSEMKALMENHQIKDFSIIESEEEKYVIVRFSDEEIFNYEFLRIANKIHSEKKVSKIYTFNIQHAIPN